MSMKRIAYIMKTAIFVMATVGLCACLDGRKAESKTIKRATSVAKAGSTIRPFCACEKSESWGLSPCAKDLTLDYPREKIIYPDDGYVPNELTAARIAEAVLVSKYGEKIYGQKPYRINLIKDSIWVVNGSVTGGGYGENAHIEIRKKDGKILKVFMGC